MAAAGSNETNYHFNHTTPNTTPYYHPSAIMEQLHTTEYQTMQTPLLHNNTLEEYRPLSRQQSTPLGQLDFTRPLQRIPADLRMPHHNSALLSITLAEACNVRYYHTTSLRTTTSHNDSYIVARLHVKQELPSKYLTSGQFILHSRLHLLFYLQKTNYLPISQHSQLIYKVDYDMGRFTEIYRLKSNYIWNYNMPLFLPDLLHYLNNHEQLHDFQHKAITTILCKSIHYFGITPLTMTKLTAQQRLQLHHFFRNYQHQVAPPD